MSVALAHKTEAAQAVSFTRDQLDLIKNVIAKGTEDDEFALFIEVCKRKNLDPFSRQIYAIKRWDPTLKKQALTFQIAIDGLRVIAERSGVYEGQEGPYWCAADGVWQDVWTSSTPPVAAKVGIYRRDFKQVLWAVALYREYVQNTGDGKPNSMWARMPANQLAKCAEALALRKAFPEQLSGLVSHEEMDQSDEPRQVPDRQPARKTVPPQPPSRQETQPEDEPEEDYGDAPPDVVALWKSMDSRKKANNALSELKRRMKELFGDDDQYKRQCALLGIDSPLAMSNASQQVLRTLAADCWMIIQQNTPPAPPEKQEEQEEEPANA